MSARSRIELPSGLYEDDNQRSFSSSKIDRLSQHSGINVKGYMPKDREKEMNRIEEKERLRRQVEAMKMNPTLAASLNGNKPARGARIDKELMEEDQMILEKMDKKKMMMMDGMSGRYI